MYLMHTTLSPHLEKIRKMKQYEDSGFGSKQKKKRESREREERERRERREREEEEKRGEKREEKREKRERREREREETAAADKYKIRQDSTPECVELELRKER